MKNLLLFVSLLLNTILLIALIIAAESPTWAAEFQFKPAATLLMGSFIIHLIALFTSPEVSKLETQ